MSTDTLNDVTYTSADKLAVVLGVDTFTATTTISGKNALPNQGEVEDFILWAEDEINQTTGHSWKATRVTDEVYDIPGNYLRGYGGGGRYGWRREVPLYVNHRDLRTFTSGTHKIELWNGNEWKDLILTANGFTEGRGSDYWIDTDKGIIYFADERPWYSSAGVRLTYDYGEATVPKDIERAATLLAAIHLLENSDYSVLLADGTDQFPLASKADNWRKEVDNILSRRAELMLI